MNEQVSSILNKTFEIDLTEIELRKGDICIKGKGVIYQKNEELHLKLFNDSPFKEVDKIKEVFNIIDTTFKTEILTEVDYFNLTGKDENENIFTSKVHAPYIASKIIEGKISGELVKTKKTKRNNPLVNILEIFVNDDGPIPLNDLKSIHISYRTSEIQSFKPLEDAWFFNVPNKYKIQVQRTDNYQRIRIETKLNVSEEEIDLILDSLRFVFGRFFNWFYINFNLGLIEKYKLRRYSVFRNTIFFPPLKINNSYNAENYENLFNCYYTFLSNRNEPAKNLNFHVRKTNIAGYSYLGAFELVLATSIEGLLKIFKIEINANKNNVDIEKVNRFLEDTFEEENEVRRRISGLLTNMHTTNAKDVLKALVSTNKLDKKYQKIYKEFRNPLAHADIQDDDPIIRLKNKDKILALFYHLIFLQIGYNGHYTNYFKDELEDFTHTI